MGLGTEIGWEIKGGHQQEGGEAFQETPRSGSPPGFSPLQPEAPCTLRIQSWTSPQTSQCPILSSHRSLD